jgi:hypothetical protein
VTKLVIVNLGLLKPCLEGLSLDFKKQGTW